MKTKSCFRTARMALLIGVFLFGVLLHAKAAPGVLPKSAITAPISSSIYLPLVERNYTAPTQVTLWYAYPPGSGEGTAFSSVLAQAAIDMPQYRINAVYVPFNDIYNTYRSEVGAGGGPDMFIAPNDSLGDDVRAGVLADITDLLVSDKVYLYAPLSIHGMSLDGKLYGIPESMKALAFWYDKTKLPTPPATTNELKSLMQGGTPISISYGCYHDWGFFGAFGGQVFDDNWKFIADSQNMIDSMTYLNSLYQISKANGWPRTDYDGLVPFTNGDVVAITNGNWAMGDYLSALGANLAVAPLPAGPGGPATPMLGVDGYMFNPHSQKKAAAIDVALYLTGNTAETEMMQAGHVPAITTATITDPLIQSLQTIFENSSVRPQVPQMGNYWTNFCGTDEVFENGVDPATWLRDATAAANQ